MHVCPLVWSSDDHTFIKFNPINISIPLPSCIRYPSVHVHGEKIVGQVSCMIELAATMGTEEQAPGRQWKKKKKKKKKKGEAAVCAGCYCSVAASSWSHLNMIRWDMI